MPIPLPASRAVSRTRSKATSAGLKWSTSGRCHNVNARMLILKSKDASAGGVSRWEQRHIFGLKTEV